MPDTPDFSITLDGRDLADRLRPRLISLSITEKRGDEADQLDLVLSDPRGDVPLPPEGAVLHVAIGWRSPGGQRQLVGKGSFQVDEVEHRGPPDTVSIRAHSVDFTGTLPKRRQTSWHGTTLGAIVSAIGARNGLQTRVAPALASVAVSTLAQNLESDLALLKRLGARHDAVATIKAGTLLFARKGSGITPGGLAIPSLTLSRSTGDQHGWKRAKREEAEGFTASWHDRKGAKRQDVTAGKADGAKRLGKTFATEGAAREAAEAARTRAARSPVTFEWTLARGRADLYPERRVTLTGWRKEITATPWLIAEVTHSMAGSGFSTKLNLESV